jgi:hypothetical protein
MVLIGVLVVQRQQHLAMVLLGDLVIQRQKLYYHLTTVLPGGLVIQHQHSQDRRFLF